MNTSGKHNGAHGGNGARPGAGDPAEDLATLESRAQLEELEDLFNDALGCISRGEVDEAKLLYKQILEREPRLPEPYLELAVISHDEGDLDNAIAAARLGLDYLEKGGQWLDNLAPNVMLAHAKNLLGRLLVEAAQRGDTPFDQERFPALWNEAAELFRQAHELDPNNTEARTNAVLHQPVETED